MTEKGTLRDRAVLVIASAPVPVVQALLSNLESGGKSVVVACSKSDKKHYQSRVQTVSFGSWVRSFSPSMWWHLLRSRYELVVFTVGRGWFHDNVVRALYFWRRITGSSFVICGVWNGNYFSPYVGDVPSLRANDRLGSRHGLWLFGGALIAIYLAVLSVGMLLFGWWGGLLLLLPILCEFSLQRKLRATRSRLAYPKATELREAILSSADPEIGYVPGNEFSSTEHVAVPSLQLERVTKVHFTSHGSRLTAPSVRMSGRARPIISIFGCSYTFGTRLNDEDTFPWILQERLSEFEVRNYSACGYSPYAALLLMRRTLRRDKPRVVVFGYAPFHDRRNTGSFVTNPWLTCATAVAVRTHRGAGWELRHTPPRRYQHFFSGKHSICLLKQIEERYNALRSIGRNDPEIVRRTAELVLHEMRCETETHGAQLVVAQLSQPALHTEFLERHGFLSNAVPFSVIDHGFEGWKDWCLYPYDSWHPNERAHLAYADLVHELIEVALERRARQTRGVQNLIPYATDDVYSPRDLIYPLY